MFSLKFTEKFLDVFNMFNMLTPTDASTVSINTYCSQNMFIE